MPRAKRLTEFEKGQIVALSSSGLSSRDIAEKIGRSKTVVNNFLSLKDNYGKKIREAGLKRCHPEVKGEFCDLLRQENIQARKLLSKQASMFVKKTFATLLEGLAIYSMQQNWLNPRYYPNIKCSVYHSLKRQ